MIRSFLSLLNFRMIAVYFGCCQGILLSSVVAKDQLVPLQISDNGHFFVARNEQPFFWLADTAWLLFKKLDREESIRYLEDRQKKGFNVIQVMAIHSLEDSANAYGQTAVVSNNLYQPSTTPGNDPTKTDEYDYWDHVDFVIKTADSLGIYVAVVPLWGSNVKQHNITEDEAEFYGQWISKRLGKHNNLIWFNGGDTKAHAAIEVWQALARGIRENDSTHLMTFHPFGRMQSSTWFHQSNWLDFNTFQSGHRRYDQDDTRNGFGQDNWRYVEIDWNLSPAKPTLDAEPSYEDIPQGLHDTNQPTWGDDDVRRYAYWSVLSGAAGFTYGHNSIMQFYQLSEKPGAFGALNDWRDALDAPGAWQMRFLRRLIDSIPDPLSRVPCQELISQLPTRDRYSHQVALRTTSRAYIYTYRGEKIFVNPNILPGDRLKASWFNPRNGSKSTIGKFDNSKPMSFDPIGSPADGNDWVLILQRVTSKHN